MQWFKRYILPGITFQSIVIGGGYCTGQELSQYFLSLGPANGFYGLLVTTVVWSIICALCFVLAKIYEAYDYKSFFKVLLGRGWFLFEICYLYLVLIALSVIAASVGSMLQDLLHIPYTIGLLFPFIYIMMMVFRGSKSIAKMFSIWSFLLYSVFIVFVICSYQNAETQNVPTVLSFPQGVEWIQNGIAYASYNLGCIPALLFTLRSLNSNKQAFISGLLAGPLASIPGIMLYMAMLSEYPQVLTKTVPSTYMLGQMAIPLLTIAFSIVLIGTLVETGVGLVHAFHERINLNPVATKTGNNRKFWNIALVVMLLIASFVLSQFGLINLIVKGYGLLTWFMLGIFILPLLTHGVVKIKSSYSS